MSVPQVVSLLMLAVLIASVLFSFLPAQRSRTQSGSAENRQFARPIFRDDDRYWLGGVIYNNSDDPDWLVPKRNMPGRTLNVGHPVGRLIMLAMVLLIVALGILSILVPGFSSYGCHPFTGCHL